MATPRKIRAPGNVVAGERSIARAPTVQGNGRESPALRIPGVDSSQENLSELFGSSQRMAEIRDTIAKVAATSAAVLISGESGTGKDFIARMIHHASPRRTSPLIKVNCAAISEDLLLRELFGEQEWSLAEGATARQGKFALARTGTLLLDEIGAMHAMPQLRLLQMLQDTDFTPFEGGAEGPFDVRLVCTTSKSLEQSVASGLFREDLFYRINIVSLDLPPLRERRDDIPVFTRLFLQKYAALYGREVVPFSAAASDAMQTYDWPGNIRELENMCKRYVIVGGETQIIREISSRGASIKRGMPGPRVAGPRVAGPRVAGPRVAGPKVIEPRGVVEPQGTTEHHAVETGIHAGFEMEAFAEHHSSAYPQAASVSLQDDSLDGFGDNSSESARLIDEGVSLLEVGRRAAWEAERSAIEHVLSATHWNRRESARKLKVSYKALLNKIKRMQQDDKKLRARDQ